MKGNADTSREISSLSRVKVIHLLFMDNCFKFYRVFALLNIDYKLINLHNTNFTSGAGDELLIYRRRVSVKSCFLSKLQHRTKHPSLRTSRPQTQNHPPDSNISQLTVTTRSRCPSYNACVHTIVFFSHLCMTSSL
jgi:hypothetical protein